MTLNLSRYGLTLSQFCRWELYLTFGHWPDGPNTQGVTHFGPFTWRTRS